MLDEKAIADLKERFAKHPGAWEFISNYAILCHGFDDLIDRDNPEIGDYKEFALDLFGHVIDVYSCKFYRDNVLWLYPLIKNIHRAFADSVLWEKSAVDWQRTVADVLRCGGNGLVAAMLEHLCRLQPAEVRNLSLIIREDSWMRHHDKDGKPV